MTRIGLKVNGVEVSAEVEPRTHLADFLRDHLLLTGTHIGCEHGICGACTVNINGEIARSCITYAVTCDGADIRTIEGYDDDPLMASLRQTFAEEHALQCGYCTPGMLVAARDLVRRKRGLSRAEIREEMSGNLCRCTGYMGIITAIERVMAAMPAASAAFQGGKSWLGPAPGPCAPSPAIGSSSGPASTGRSRSPTRIARGLRHRSRPSIRVDVGQLQEVDGATRISERFVLDHPREAVWALISDPRAMARCMPGLALDDLRGEGQLTGRLEVRIGPISAQFAGTGTLAKFAPEYRLRIVGQGGDRRSGSLATGGVECRLEAIPAGEKGNATEVTAIISYVLTGPLVQFGRSGIVRDFVQRIGETFAQNLDQELRDPGSLGPSAPLGGLSVLFRIVGARLRDLLYKISRGRQSE